MFFAVCILLFKKYRKKLHKIFWTLLLLGTLRLQLLLLLQLLCEGGQLGLVGGQLDATPLLLLFILLIINMPAAGSGASD